MVGVLLAVAFLFVFVIPEYREAARLRVRIAETKLDVEVRTRLAPVLAKLVKAEAALGKIDLPSKPVPMPLAEVDQLTARFDAMAKPLGLRLMAVTPQANSAGKNGRLAVNLRLLGTMDGFHEFLTTLSRFAPLVSVESSATVVGEEGRELLLKCWLAVR